MGMSFRWHVHYSRTVYGKNYDQKSFQRLLCKQDHRSYVQVYVQVLNSITDKRTEGHRGMSQKASNSVVKCDMNSSLHNQVLGSNTVVTKQNGLEKATLPFCPDSGSQEVTSIYTSFESLRFPKIWILKQLLTVIMAVTDHRMYLLIKRSHLHTDTSEIFPIDFMCYKMNHRLKKVQKIWKMLMAQTVVLRKKGLFYLLVNALADAILHAMITQFVMGM